MTITAVGGATINQSLLPKYFHSLINRFFKILPMRESSEATLQTYMCSLRAELLGCSHLIPDIGDSASYITLLSILQYLIDNHNEPVPVIKREVFRAINICSKLEAIYKCQVAATHDAKGGGHE